MRTRHAVLAGLVAVLVAGTARAQTGPRIEVAFALDATGSMGPYIDDARAHIRAIVDGLRAGEPAPTVRFALVAYRDRGDDFVTRVHPFTSDSARMQSYLDRTAASGGGDWPESVLEGVRDALTGLAWSPPSEPAMRLLYVVGDAPPQRYPDGPNEAWLAAEAARRDIVIHSVLCGTGLDSPESRQPFESLARYTEGHWYELREGRPRSAGSSSAGGDSHRSLGATVAESTRAYSRAVGVDFDAPARTALSVSPVATGAPVPTTGLVGRQVRWVRDSASWSDLWAAHVSLAPEAARPSPPEVDFAASHVLVVGGSGGGLAVEAVETDGSRRWARLRPTDRAGASFLLVPATTEGSR